MLNTHTTQLFLKMSQRLTKEDKQMAYKYMKRCSMCHSRNTN